MIFWGVRCNISWFMSGFNNRLMKSDLNPIEITRGHIIIRMSINYNKWTPIEDSRLKTLVSKLGTRKWKQIAQQLAQQGQQTVRSGKQCRERWLNTLSKTNTKEDWTEEEEERLLQVHARHGNQWTLIRKSFDGRSDNAVKNHFFGIVRRSLRELCRVLKMKNTTATVSGIKPSTISRVLRLGANPQLPLEAGEESLKIGDFTQIRRIIMCTIFDKNSTMDKSDARWVLTKLQQINQIYLGDHSQGVQSLKSMEQEAEGMPEMCIDAPAMGKTTDLVEESIYYSTPEQEIGLSEASPNDENSSSLLEVSGFYLPLPDLLFKNTSDIKQIDEVDLHFSSQEDLFDSFLDSPSPF